MPYHKFGKSHLWSVPVPAHRHLNPDDTMGGWVADTANVDATVTVSKDSSIYGSAHIYGKVKVVGGSEVFEGAIVNGISGGVLIENRSKIHGEARIFHFANIENSLVDKNAEISGKARVRNESIVSGRAQIAENACLDGAEVNGCGYVCGNAYVQGRVRGNAQVGENAHIRPHARLSGNVKVGGNVTIYETSNLVTGVFYDDENPLLTDNAVKKLIELDDNIGF